MTIFDMIAVVLSAIFLMTILLVLVSWMCSVLEYYQTRRAAQKLNRKNSWDDHCDIALTIANSN